MHGRRLLDSGALAMAPDCLRALAGWRRWPPMLVKKAAAARGDFGACFRRFGWLRLFRWAMLLSFAIVISDRRHRLRPALFTRR